MIERENFLSKDDYIIAQYAMSAYPYGNVTSNYNGCGWIAAYNLVHGLGLSFTYKEVYEDMIRILPYKGMAGTPTRTLHKYLTIKEITFTKTRGKKSVLECSKNCRAGVIRYMEGFEPHYVAFIKVNEDKFRYLNIKEGKEDIIMTMKEFLKTHCLIPYVKATMVK